MKIEILVKFYTYKRLVKADAFNRIKELKTQFDTVYKTASQAVVEYLAAVKAADTAEAVLHAAMAAGTDSDADAAAVTKTTAAATAAFAKLTKKEIALYEQLSCLQKQLFVARQNPMLVNPCDRVALSIKNQNKLYRCNASDIGVTKADAGRTIECDITVDKDGKIISIKRC